MKRFWFDQILKVDDQTVIQGDLFHHIFDVCRQGLSSKFELLNEHHQAYFVEVIEVQKKRALVKVKEIRTIPALPKPWITLALSVPKFPVLEAVLEKSVELGVHQIQLLYSDHSFIRSNDKALSGKWDRWEKIIKTATQQTGRGELLKLRPPIPLVEYAQSINPTEGHAGLFSYEGTGGLAIKSHFAQSARTLLEQVSLFVGSEGGFSLAEVEKMKNLGFHPVSLGSQILRVETACLTLVSVLKYELDLFK